MLFLLCLPFLRSVVFLQFDVVQSSESLPETLDIGDVSEPGNFTDSASLKMKKAAAEASTSSSPSAPASVS